MLVFSRSFSSFMDIFLCVLEVLLYLIHCCSIKRPMTIDRRQCGCRIALVYLGAKFWGMIWLFRNTLFCRYSDWHVVGCLRAWTHLDHVFTFNYCISTINCFRWILASIICLVQLSGMEFCSRDTICFPPCRQWFLIKTIIII